MKFKLIFSAITFVTVISFLVLAQSQIVPQNDGYPDGTGPLGVGTPDQGWYEYYYGIWHGLPTIHITCSYMATGGCN